MEKRNELPSVSNQIIYTPGSQWKASGKHSSRERGEKEINCLHWAETLCLSLHWVMYYLFQTMQQPSEGICVIIPILLQRSQRCQQGNWFAGKSHILQVTRTNNSNKNKNRSNNSGNAVSGCRNVYKSEFLQ